jgi:hypothetical protein
MFPKMPDQYYDIVGDIHGHADALRRLLIKLDYTEDQGAFRHAERKMIFLGDFIDRGPEQRQVLRIVRIMCEAGTASAVLGNHEFNAIGWATPDGNGEFLRTHSDEKNVIQHKEFLQQIGEGSADHRDTIQWFRDLPVWLDFPDFRVVHACWHEPSRAALQSCLDDRNCFTEDGIQKAYRRDTQQYAAAEILLKGPEQRLPPGMCFKDKDGRTRQDVRLRWWDRDATTFRKAAFGMDDRLEELPDDKLPIDYRYLEGPPVFFGHYWLKDKPTIRGPSAACLDFSVADKGYLTAYRWSGERELSSGNLVHVPAESP